jgi:magnesium transporter
VADWIDLLDPTPEELAARLPPGLCESDRARLRAPGAAGRPGLSPHGDHVFGVLLVAVAVPAENDVYYQEIDVVLTRELLLTVRKTTPGRPPFDSAALLAAHRPHDSPALSFYRLVDEVADRYLDLVDDVEEEIGELEDQLDELEPERVGSRIRELRYQILHVRRTLAPMRDAVRAVVDGRIDIEGGDLFTPQIRHECAGALDLFLRAADGLELAHDLLAGAREYHQAKIAQDQNDVIRFLTAVASLILIPTFIVGLYGQNFRDIPEFHWGIWGYIWSWGVILAATLVQLWFFRRKNWL